jgi:hypothetical protein
MLREVDRDMSTQRALLLAQAEASDADERAVAAARSVRFE